MARILYGVHGTGRGHAIRASTLAQHYSQHDFLFVCHGEAARLLGGQFRVFECPNPVTPVGSHRVDAPAALLRTAATLSNGAHWRRRVEQAAEAFVPDLAMTDYEFFVPQVARRMGVACLSLDNQHVITMGRITCPLGQMLSRLATAAAVRLLFSSADQYLVCNFFDVPARAASPWLRQLPPLLRRDVVARRPTPGDHVVAYQGYPTFPAFVEHLATLGRPVRVYGLGERCSLGRVVFKAFDEQSFLDDLASCAFVVCGGGHTLISEALHLGKPVLSIPVRGAFEQFLNAYYLERLGYGMRADLATFSSRILHEFEVRLESYRARIGHGDFCGNDAAFAAIDAFIDGRWRRSPRSGPRART
ncbi:MULTISPECIES: glycosyltransferase family protein [unclassified Bradyrhizobium]|uniref:glycosyltransferase family protein n=1 Tax=unclassified Bradyrhizobium TaxID=2631580 RepID=UPI0028E8BBE6|nr:MULTISPECIES: glycosyltransferase family protein [unclassified Bradyrhizobium]